MSTLKNRPEPGLDEHCCEAPDDRKVILNEVVVRYRIGGTGRELSIDPGRVDALFWDDEAWRLYLLGLGGSSPEVVDAMSTPAIQDQPASTRDFGVHGTIRYHLDHVGWVEIADCVVSEIIMRYYSRKQKRHFETRMPAHSQDRTRNVTPNETDESFLTRELSVLSRLGGLQPRYVDEGVHALFWNREYCEPYRRGLQIRDGKVSPLLKVNPQGEYIDLPLPNLVHAGTLDPATIGSTQPEVAHMVAVLQTETFSRYELFRADYPALAGRYNSVTTTVCKHFNNCDWSCVEDTV